MIDDPLQSIADSVAERRGDELRERMAKERRTQTAARRVRTSLRWALMLFAVAGYTLFFYVRTSWAITVGFCCLLFVLVLAVALFLMGGLAPSSVRSKLTERERRMLDK